METFVTYRVVRQGKSIYHIKNAVKLATSWNVFHEGTEGKLNRGMLANM
jgi:hypothetical protein